MDFFKNEFKLDFDISQMKPTTISIWNGYTLGGGVGLSINSDIKIATEKTLFGMPEAKIGFFVDVGISHFFSRT